MGPNTLTALGLGVEKPDPQAMRLPPRPPSEPLLTLPVALRAYLFLGLLEAGVAMAAFFLVLVNGGWTYGQQLAWSDPLYMRATTACLSAIIVMQVANVFMCRGSVRSIFAVPPFDNPLIIWGVGIEIALLFVVNYSPSANALLNTMPMSSEVWLLLAPCVSGSSRWRNCARLSCAVNSDARRALRFFARACEPKHRPTTVPQR